MNTTIQTSSETRYQTFEQFWPFYLSQHRNATCRNLHFFGTTLGIIFLGYCFYTKQYPLALASPVFGYFFAWIGHFMFEKNRPATFTYPKWSFAGDLKMLKLFYTGKLGAELKKFGIQ